MAYSFYKYNIQEINREFVRSDGYSTPTTIQITLYNSQGVEITQFNLANPDLSNVYDAIGRGEDINLDFCYIKNFSSTACKRFLDIPKTELLEVKSFSAQNAFFESPLSVDLSLVKFAGKVIIDDSYLIAQTVDFKGVNHVSDDFFITNSYIKTQKFNFTQFIDHGNEFSFKNSAFDTGVKDFQDSDFNSNEVVFTNTDFGDGDVSFINAKFNNSDVNFKVASFGVGKVDFHFASFGSGRVVFERANFGSGRVDFRTVVFGSGKASFNRSSFVDGEINFEGVEVHSGKVTFKRAAFGSASLFFELYQGNGSDLIFERSVFNSAVSFRGALTNNLVLEECQFNFMVNLHVEKADVIDLSGCTFRDIVEFYTHAQKPKVNILNMAGVRLLGYFYINWDENNLKQLIYNQQNTSVFDKAEQFRVLKENFNSLGKYNEEDKAYVEFKRCELKSKVSKAKARGFFKSTMAQISAFFQRLLFDHMGLYATSPQRVILSILVIYTVYSLIYILTMLAGVGHIMPSATCAEGLSVVAKGFYFSVVTFFTIGYGDFAPVGISRVIAGTEGFVGVFLMSYFTVAFVRKILR